MSTNPKSVQSNNPSKSVIPTNVPPLTPKLRFKEFEGEWVKNKLGELGDFKGGGTPSTDNSEYWEGEIPWISSSDVYESDVTRLNITRYITMKAVEESATKIVSKNSILFVSRVGVGKLAINKEDLCTSQDFANLCPSNDIDSYFIAYFFIAKNKLLHQYSQGTSIKGFTTGDLKSIPIKLPTLPEQQKIASFLTAVDEKIQQLIRKKTLLEQYKKGVMQKLFAQELRFKPDQTEASGDENRNDYPDWEGKKLGEVATNKSKKFNPQVENRSVKCIELEHLTSESGTLIGYTEGNDLGSIKSIFQEGDVLFGKLRPYLKKFLLAPFDGVCSSEIWVLTGLNISNQFLYCLIQSDQFMDLANKSSGSKMPRADWKVISEAYFNIPCLEEQQKIATYLSSLDQKIETVNHQITHTQTFKKGLLQGMFV